MARLPFEVGFRGEAHRAHVTSFDINEMLGTKLHALFQRRRGRDLFDLYWAISVPSPMPVDASRVIDAFQHYMDVEGSKVPRQDFLDQLDAHLSDRGFLLGHGAAAAHGPHLRPAGRRGAGAKRIADAIAGITTWAALHALSHILQARAQHSLEAPGPRLLSTSAASLELSHL